MRAPGADKREISCLLDASGATQRFRFKANFSGGHDDSRASLTPTLDGSPLVCDKDSKTGLTGEDGDVSIDCRFSVTRPAGTRPVLAVRLWWSHAEYAGFEFGSE